MIRADIDNQDILNVLRDTRKRFGAEAASLVAAYLALALIAAGAGRGLYRAGLSVIGEAGRTDGLAALTGAAHGKIAAALFCASLIALCAATAAAIHRARGRLRAARLAEAAKPGLCTGRFDYSFADQHLVVKGPLAVKKIAWSALTRLEETKSSIVFRREDGGFEFIPKNVLSDAGLMTQLRSQYASPARPRIGDHEKLCANPLGVTYELLRSDNAEYEDYYFRRHDGTLHFFRKFFQWPALAPFGFAVCALVAALDFYAAFRASSLPLALSGLAFACLAGGVFVLKSEHFRGPAHPFRKPGDWPFAQSNPTTVTLSGDAVYWQRRGDLRIIQWGGVESFVERRLCAYLILAPGTAIALPKRAFAGPKHFQSFAAYARRHIAEADRARREAKQRRLARSIGKRDEEPAVAPKRRSAAAAGGGRVVSITKAAKTQRMAAPARSLGDPNRRVPA